MNSKDDLSGYNNELALEQADEIINIIRNIQKNLNTLSSQSEKHYGFTTPQLLVIFYLNKRPSITLNELSCHMKLAKSTVSGIIDRLTNQGVVIREIPENNRRIVKLSISEEFKNTHDISNLKKSFISSLISNKIRNTDPEEMEKIIYGLRQFNSLLSNNDFN